jgi:hypothetical protein
VATPISQSIADMMRVPFPELEFIQIESEIVTEPLVIDDFLGGSAPRLKEIHVEGIAIPFLALRRLLLSTHDLVKLHLHDIPESCSSSPHALVAILSSLDHLQKLSIRFRPPASRLTTNMETPLKHSTFPSLISLKFDGASEYLDAFVARSHMPVLDWMVTRFYNQAIIEIPHFVGLLSRREGIKVLTRANITLEEKSVRVHFLEKVSPVIKLELSILCRGLDWKLSLLTQIFNQLSPLLSSAHLLAITKGYFQIPSGREDVDPAQWLEFLQSLPHFSEVSVYVHDIVPDILHALVNEDMAAGVLPSLTSLKLRAYRRPQSMTDMAERFVANRKLANQNIVLHYAS